MLGRYGTNCQVSFWTIALNSSAIACFQQSYFKACVKEVGSHVLPYLATKDNCTLVLKMPVVKRVCMVCTLRAAEEEQGCEGGRWAIVAGLGRGEGSCEKGGRWADDGELGCGQRVMEEDWVVISRVGYEVEFGPDERSRVVLLEEGRGGMQ